MARITNSEPSITVRRELRPLILEDNSLEIPYLHVPAEFPIEVRRWRKDIEKVDISPVPHLHERLHRKRRLVGD